jgi:hypothetical protein
MEYDAIADQINAFSSRADLEAYVVSGFLNYPSWANLLVYKYFSTIARHEEEVQVARAERDKLEVEMVSRKLEFDLVVSSLQGMRTRGLGKDEARLNEGEEVGEAEQNGQLEGAGMGTMTPVLNPTAKPFHPSSSGGFCSTAAPRRALPHPRRLFSISPSRAATSRHPPFVLLPVRVPLSHLRNLLRLCLARWRTQHLPTTTSRWEKWQRMSRRASLLERENAFLRRILRKERRQTRVAHSQNFQTSTRSDVHYPMPFLSFTCPCYRLETRSLRRASCNVDVRRLLWQSNSKSQPHPIFITA